MPPQLFFWSKALNSLVCELTLVALHTAKHGGFILHSVNSKIYLANKGQNIAHKAPLTAKKQKAGARGEMKEALRRTIVVHGRLAMRELRLTAARQRRHGLQIMTFEQLAERLAGGMTTTVDDETLRSLIQSALRSTPLGEIDGIKDLPGMVGAASDTLRKVWRAGIDLQMRANAHSRLASIARLEQAVVAGLFPAMLRPPDLASAALQRLRHAATLFGPIEIIGITELSPIWRPLLKALAEQVPVTWIAGPRTAPAWLEDSAVSIKRDAPHAPDVVTVSAATAYHEAIEAMRWARQLIASGNAKPSDIAIAAVAPADYDDYFLALRADANIDLHFAHGTSVMACREGQAAAALADILVRGLSQSRLGRLATLLSRFPGPFENLPKGWMRLLPPGAPLVTPKSWTRLLSRLTAVDWPDGNNHSQALLDIISLLSEGVVGAAVAGETLLLGKSLNIWRKALLAGPAASLDLTLATLKHDDGLEPCVSVTWMPASALAASPRPYVRLLGLNSSRWPRPISEDRILSDHIIPNAELDPLPAGAADRRDFETIHRTTARQVVLSRARRDSEGRLLGRSTLLLSNAKDVYLARNRVPEHVFSETDRLMARPQEFRDLPQATSASLCWRNWLRPEITPHDGLMRAGHPVLKYILDRVQSASSLKLLLRNPLGFLWHHGFHWAEPENGHDPLVLDAAAMGNLIHSTLDLALQNLEAGGGLSVATPEQISAAVDAAAIMAASLWEEEQAVPPLIIWKRTLDEARTLSSSALAFNNNQRPGARSYGEVPFGGAIPKSGITLPWDASTTVEIPGAGFRIRGYIDRLEISVDDGYVLVRDYKTGKTPKETIVLDGGKELQRCLYASAVRVMLGDNVKISASLLYLKDGTNLELADSEKTLLRVVSYLRAARANFLSGGSVIGIDADDPYNELAFALPANAAAAYCPRKLGAAINHMADAAEIWEAP